MKIKLSKSQWEEFGKQAGWIKKEAAGKILKEIPAKIQVSTLDNQKLMFQLIVGNGEYQTWLDGSPTVANELQEVYKGLLTQTSPVAGTPAAPKTV